MRALLLCLFGLLLGQAPAWSAPKGREIGDEAVRAQIRNHPALQSVRPGKLATTAVLVQEDGDQLYIVDEAKGLWVGQPHDMKRLLSLAEIPTGLALGEHLIVWRTVRRGLVAHTAAQSIHPRTGAVLDKHEEDALLLDAISIPGTDGLLFPGGFVVLGDRAGAAPLLLPPASTGTLLFDEGRLIIELDDRAYTFDPSTLCPAAPLPPPRDALERLATDLLSRRCGARASSPPPESSPPGTAEDAALVDIDRQVAALRAAARGDAVRLQALGIRGEAAVEAYRPRESDKGAPFRTRNASPAALSSSLRGSGMTIVLHDPPSTEELAPWIVGPDAPACFARLVLAPADEAQANWWSTEVDRQLQAHPGGCGPDVLVARPGEAADPKAETAASGLWFIDKEGKLQGSHAGSVTPRMARLDLARSREDNDPLRSLAELPELTPEWVAGPGPTEALALDVDGSWVAGSGWDLLRGTPDKLRLDRVPLPGPVRRVGVLKDGRFHAESGGEHLIIDIERRTRAWGQGGELPTSRAANRALDSKPWTVEAGIAYRNHPTKKGQRYKVTLPVPITRGQGNGEGLICETRLGLIGLNGEGQAVWRITELNDWVLTGGFLLTATSTGIRAYLLPG